MYFFFVLTWFNIVRIYNIKINYSFGELNFYCFFYNNKGI